MPQLIGDYELGHLVGRRTLYLPAWDHSRGAALDAEDVGVNLIGAPPCLRKVSRWIALWS